MLERLGNRKSAVIVEALNEYISSHPDLVGRPGEKINVKIESGIRREMLEALVRSLIDERVKEIETNRSQSAYREPQDVLDKGIAEIISNLDMFEG